MDRNSFKAFIPKMSYTAQEKERVRMRNMFNCFSVCDLFSDNNVGVIAVCSESKMLTVCNLTDPKGIFN